MGKSYVQIYDSILYNLVLFFIYIYMYIHIYLYALGKSILENGHDLAAWILFLWQENGCSIVKTPVTEKSPEHFCYSSGFPGS